MRINRKNRLIIGSLIAAFVLLCSSVCAQSNQFRYKADIAKVDSDGVYKIELQPTFIAKTVGSDLNDIRVIDETGRFIPYAIITNPLEKSKPYFVEFPEVKPAVGTDTMTVYIADAGANSSTAELWLKLKNTAVNRMANLAGSDDLKHWFAIEEGVELQSAGAGNGSEYEQQLTFPRSSYRYFRVEIPNKGKDPLRILRAGVYTGDRISQVMFSYLPSVKLSVKNRNGLTSYFADFGGNYQVEELQLAIASPKYYNRHILVYNIGHRAEEKLYDDSISSANPKPIDISARTSKLRIDVVNGDDNPLVIRGIMAMQQKRFVVSYLEKGHQYHLLTGDSTAREVSYDLTFLHSKPSSQFSTISYAPVYNNPAYLVAKTPVHHNFTLLLWSAIVVVLLILSLLTWRMVKELNAKNTGNTNGL